MSSWAMAGGLVRAVLAQSVSNAVKYAIFLSMEVFRCFCNYETRFLLCCAYRFLSVCQAIAVYAFIRAMISCTCIRAMVSYALVGAMLVMPLSGR